MTTTAATPIQVTLQSPEPDQTLIATAQGLGSLIRAHAEEAERNRRLARPVLDAMAEAGFFRMFTPRSLGGLEVDPITCARVMEELALIDSAAGWAIQAGNSADWWCSRLPDEGVEEIYAENPSAIVCAAFHPPVPALEENGGYRLTGQRPLASNIHDADWLWLNGLVMDGEQPKLVDGAPQVVAAIFPAREAEIVDTWDSLGMRGSDSNDVRVDGVFVPGRRSFPMTPQFEPGRHYRGLLYRLPAMAEVAVISAPMFLAIARGAIEEVRELAQAKTPFGSATVLRQRPMAQARLAQAEAILRAARLLFYDTLQRAWERTVAGEPSSPEQKADLLLAATHAATSAVTAVELVYSVAGTTGIYARSRIERHFRDVHTLRHHGFISESRYETVGQVYLGLPPEFGFVTF